MAYFIIYTYQFSPVSNLQVAIDREVLPLQERMERKQEFINSFFDNEAVSKFKFRNKQFKHKMLYNEGGVMLFKIANQKNRSFEEDFQKRKISESPSCFVIIDNRVDVQRIYIEHRSTSFSDPNIVARILQSTFNKHLNAYGLNVEVNKEYQESEFWNIIKMYPQGITMVRFQLKYPNLPRVWSSVQELLKTTSIDTNSHETILQYKSDEDSCLEINENNEQINGLTKASADSGSVILIKAKGIKAYIKTGNTEKGIEIDDVEIKLTPDLLENPFEKIITLLNKAK
jgi:hypothetical protein